MTAKFLRGHGEKSDVRTSTFFVDVVWDFFRAIAIVFGGKHRAPLGVWLHGVMLPVLVVLLFTYLVAPE